MFTIQRSLCLQWLLLIIWHLVLPMTETSSLKPEGNHPSQSSTPVDARLVNGGNLCSGRLEMKHQGEWRPLSVKEDYSESTASYAEVACRQMGCGSVVSVAHNSNNNNTEQRAWEVQFYCSGPELTLKECSSTKTRRRVQGRATSASSLEVVCSESVRLVGRAGVCAGSAMVKSDQGWVPACEDGFDSEAKNVVCRELGCGPSVYSWGPSGEAERPVLSKQFQCKGNESRLEDCASSMRNNCKAASGISCTNLNDVRLVGGESNCKGTLEGKYDGEWRPLHDLWRFLRTEDFIEICELAGCGGVISSSTRHLPSSTPVWELSTSCSRSGSSFCKAWERVRSHSVITLTCSEFVRIINGPSRCSGKIEVKSGQSWFPVCETSFSSKAALVVCRDLECGFPPEYYGRKHNKDFQDTEGIWNPVFECEGKERHLMDCPFTTINTTEVDLRSCTSTYLSCSELPSQPYVSVITPHWRVPGDSKDLTKGHHFAIKCESHSPYSVLSFRLKSAIFTKNATEQVQPSVDQKAIFMFPAAEDSHHGAYQCDYNYDFSPDIFSEPRTFFLQVKEHSYVRLVNGGSRCAGRLEMEHQREWRPISHQHSWGLEEAAVLCRQLDCGSAVSTSKDDNSTERLPVWRFYSDCDGSERALMDCGAVEKWFSSSVVQVVCSEVLLQPKTTVFSMSDFSDDQQQNEMLHEGYGFTISCSVEPQYPGGHFSLIFTGINQSHSWTQPAVNHTAHFTYTAADYSHQGNYTCAYHNFAFNHNFSSESHSLYLFVNAIKNVMLDDGVLREDPSEPCAGKLLALKEDEWRLVSMASTVWDLKHASLVCRQLGCGSAVSTKGIDLHRNEQVWRFFSDCDGSESALLDCGTLKLWVSSSAVEIVCTDHDGEAGRS